MPALKFWPLPGPRPKAKSYWTGREALFPVVNFAISVNLQFQWYCRIWTRLGGILGVELQRVGFRGLLCLLCPSKCPTQLCSHCIVQY